MKAEKLFTGVAVVIDDEIGKKVIKGKADINKLIKQMDKCNMPYLTFTELPDDNCIEHFNGISFLLLDWNLHKEGIKKVVTAGVKSKIKIPDAIDKFAMQDNIDFLKKLKKNCFIPVFIFTNEYVGDVITELEKNGLYKSGSPNYIFVKGKSELETDTLFKEIDSWIKESPSIYALKEWEREYGRAKNLLFNNFYGLSPSWPKILWDAFSDDGVNITKELGEVITRNLHSRMTPFEFESEYINGIGTHEVNKDELRRVLEGERFITMLHGDKPATGDVFFGKITDDGQDFHWLNIRAQCDLVHSGNPELYCIKGRIVNEDNINKAEEIAFDNGQFIEKINHAVVSCINKGKIVEFLFRDLKVVKWNKLKSMRIGRLLPPYITRIQQRYALYFKRQGIPRTPEAILPEEIQKKIAAKKKAAEKKIAKKTSKTVSKK